MNDVIFPGRVGLQQRVLPEYRAPFFDALAAACQGGLSVFAGQPLPEEHITISAQLRAAQYYPGRNRHLFTPGSPFYQCRQEGLLGWLESWQPDVLVVEANPRYTSTPKAIAWMHKRNKPVLGWGLGAPPLGGPLAAWRGHKRSAFLNSLEALIAYSQRGAQEYVSSGFPAEQVFVAYNAAAARPSWPMVERPVQQPGAASEQRAQVLFVGRLQARKRVDNLLRACAELPVSLQPRLRIVGDGPAMAELQSLAQAIYPLAEFSGARHGAELEACFRQADVFVLPGTGGLAVQQAMAYGLPVIVAEADGTQGELVRPENGWLLTADDQAALVHALEEALADIPRLRRMGSASYRIVMEEVNLESMVAVFVRAMLSVA